MSCFSEMKDELHFHYAGYVGPYDAVYSHCFVLYCQLNLMILNIRRYNLLKYFVLFSQDKAQEKFMRIKHAYNTLLNSTSRRKYDSGNRGSGSHYSSQRSQSGSTQAEEEFYGLGKL